MEASILQIGVHCAQLVENISEVNVAIHLNITEYQCLVTKCVHTKSPVLYTVGL